MILLFPTLLLANPSTSNVRQEPWRALVEWHLELHFFSDFSVLSRRLLRSSLWFEYSTPQPEYGILTERCEQ